MATSKTLCRLHLLMVVSLIGVGASADPTGMYTKAGGTLAMIGDHPDVALLNETIDVTVGHSGGLIKVALAFENTGAAQEVLMGFPVFDGPTGAGGVSDFTVDADGVPIEVALTEKEVENGPSIRAGAYQASPLWYLMKVPFAAGQMRSLRVSYRQAHQKEYGRPALRYFYGTGGNWKGAVECIDMRIHFTDPENWRFYGDNTWERASDGTYSKRLEGYDSKDGDFEIRGSCWPQLSWPRTCEAQRWPKERSWGIFGGRALVRLDWLRDVLGATAKVADGRMAVLVLPGDRTITAPVVETPTFAEAYAVAHPEPGPSQWVDLDHVAEQLGERLRLEGGWIRIQ